MLALAQTSTLIGDLDGAARCLREQTAAAAAQGARLIIFPELVACGGYPPRDLLERRWFVAAQWRMVQEVARMLKAASDALRLVTMCHVEQIGCVPDAEASGKFRDSVDLDQWLPELRKIQQLCITELPEIVSELTEFDDQDQ